MSEKKSNGYAEGEYFIKYSFHISGTLIAVCYNQVLYFVSDWFITFSTSFE